MVNLHLHIHTCKFLLQKKPQIIFFNEDYTEYVKAYSAKSTWKCIRQKHLFGVPEMLQSSQFIYNIHIEAATVDYDTSGELPTWCHNLYPLPFTFCFRYVLHNGVCFDLKIWWNNRKKLFIMRAKWRFTEVKLRVTLAPFFLASWANEIAVSQGSTTVSPGIHSAPLACFRSPGSLLYNSERLISVQNEIPVALHLCAMVGIICASKRKFIHYFFMFSFSFFFFFAWCSYYNVCFFLHCPQHLNLYELSKKAKI